MNFILLYFIYAYQAVLFGVCSYFSVVYFHDREKAIEYTKKDPHSVLFSVEIASCLFFVTYLLLTIFLVRVCKHVKSEIKVKEKNDKLYTNVKTVET